MPRGDGTGPSGQGPGTGRGRGRGKSAGGKARGFKLGPGGECVCPDCGKLVAHELGVPCTQINCPECGAAMTRKM